MPGAGRYIVQVTNDNAGANNPALLTFFVAGSGVTSQSSIAAQLIALMQYLAPAVTTRVRGIEYSVSPSGPTLPVAFPLTQYGLLDTPDPNIIPMAAYNVPFGAGALTALGVGAVVSRRTLTPGRSGRGRFTTPWLQAPVVDAAGKLNAVGLNAITNGLLMYLDGAPGLVPLGIQQNLFEYVRSPTTNTDSLIVARSVATRLGRLRSRTQ